MRPVIYPDTTIVMPPKFCASVAYYAHIWRYGNYCQDWNLKFDKRDKETHRFVIADTRGELSLTVPIAKPVSYSCRWSEIEISTHGAWWDVHRVALESAYGRTPFFEFYIDRFLPMLTVGVEDRFPRLDELALAWDAEIRDILGLAKQENGCINTDNRFSGMVDGRDDSFKDYENKMLPYYQVREERLGFIPNLSILDLIFNLGAEAQLYLYRLSALL